MKEYYVAKLTGVGPTRKQIRITIPKEVVEELGLKVGGYMTIQATKKPRKIIITPTEIVVMEEEG